jgi:hypothetical protein
MFVKGVEMQEVSSFLRGPHSQLFLNTWTATVFPPRDVVTDQATWRYAWILQAVGSSQSADWLLSCTGLNCLLVPVWRGEAFISCRCFSLAPRASWFRGRPSHLYHVVCSLCPRFRRSRASGTDLAAINIHANHTPWLWESLTVLLNLSPEQFLINLFLQLLEIGIGTAQMNLVSVFKGVCALKECDHRSTPPFALVATGWIFPELLCDQACKQHVLMCDISLSRRWPFWLCSFGLNRRVDWLVKAEVGDSSLLLNVGLF